MSSILHTLMYGSRLHYDINVSLLVSILMCFFFISIFRLKWTQGNSIWNTLAIIIWVRKTCFVDVSLEYRKR